LEREKWVIVGETLRKAREALGLTLEQLSQKTDIPVWKLRLIEEGQFDRVDAPFYVRHYIRLCAQQLGLDADQLIGAEDLSKERVEPESRRKECSTAGFLNTLMMVVCLIALVMFIYSAVKFFGVLNQPSAKLVNTGNQAILLDGKPVVPGESVLLKVGSRYKVENNKGGCTIVTMNRRWVIRVENFEVVLWER